jgi:hypothetical protein
LLFFATNAKDQVVVSVPTENQTVTRLCEKHGIRTTTSISEDRLRAGDNIYCIRDLLDAHRYPMVGHLLMALLPVGHIKSTLPNDDEFVLRVKHLPKWLKMDEQSPI